jgi:ketosteroid isomerase-like protein
MSLRHPTPMRILLAFAAVVVLAPGIAVAGAGTGGDADDGAQIVADAKRVEMAIVAAYNDKRWDELPPLFAEDALLLPPNHDPVRGRDAIVEYYKSGRDVLGKINEGWEFLRVKGSGNFASLAGLVTLGSGGIRLWYTDLYERQPDGSVQMVVNAFAFPERPVG